MKNPFVTWITSPEALLLKMVINWGETWSPYLLFSPWNDNNLKRQGWVMVILDSGLILPPTLLSEVTHSHFTANDLLRLHLYNGREEREGAGLHPKSSSARTHYFSQYLASPVSDTKREYHGGGSLLQGGAWPPGAAPRGLATRWVATPWGSDGPTGVQWVQARDVARRPTMHRNAFCLRAKILWPQISTVPRVSSPEVSSLTKGLTICARNQSKNDIGPMPLQVYTPNGGKIWFLPMSDLSWGIHRISVDP